MSSPSMRAWGWVVIILVILVAVSGTGCTTPACEKPDGNSGTDPGTRHRVYPGYSCSGSDRYPVDSPTHTDIDPETLFWEISSGRGSVG